MYPVKFLTLFFLVAIVIIGIYNIIKSKISVRFIVFTIIAITLVLLVVGIGAYFYTFSNSALSTDSSDWGHFGNYLSGIIALFALAGIFGTLYLSHSTNQKTQKQLDLTSTSSLEKTLELLISQLPNEVTFNDMAAIMSIEGKLMNRNYQVQEMAEKGNELTENGVETLLIVDGKKVNDVTIKEIKETARKEYEHDILNAEPFMNKFSDIVMFIENNVIDDTRKKIYRNLIKSNLGKWTLGIISIFLILDRHSDLIPSLESWDIKLATAQDIYDLGTEANKYI